MKDYIMKILVVEDDYMMIRAIQHKLKSEGYEVDAVADGIKACEMIAQADYDLVMTDILMPFVGGFELINKIRNELNLKMPIIVLSSLSNEDSIIEAFKLGADDYITKPFSPNEVSIRVKRLLIKR
jgi:two-component system, OmpR family, response regulator VicR